MSFLLNHPLQVSSSYTSESFLPPRATADLNFIERHRENIGRAVQLLSFKYLTPKGAPIIFSKQEMAPIRSALQHLCNKEFVPENLRDSAYSVIENMFVQCLKKSRKDSILQAKERLVYLKARFRSGVKKDEQTRISADFSEMLNKFKELKRAPFPGPCDLEPLRFKLNIDSQDVDPAHIVIFEKVAVIQGKLSDCENKENEPAPIPQKPKLSATKTDFFSTRGLT